MTPAQQLIQAQVKDSVLSLSFGGGFAFERAHSHALRSWDIVRAAVPGVWTDFNAFVDASQWDPLETDGVPHGLPPHSIPFYDWNSSTFSDAHLFQAHVGLWHVLDMKARNPSRVIPSQSVFRPYEQTSKKRQGRMMKDVDLRPLWFIRSDGELGVPVVGELPALWHGDKDYDRPRTTMKIKFDWPGYMQWERQIRPESGVGDHSVKRFATLVARKVCAFLREHESSRAGNGTDSRFIIGNLPGQISAHDVLLLGIVHVSCGAAMPIMQLREGFSEIKPLSGQTSH